MSGFKYSLTLHIIFTVLSCNCNLLGASLRPCYSRITIPVEYQHDGNECIGNSYPASLRNYQAVADVMQNSVAQQPDSHAFSRVLLNRLQQSLTFVQVENLSNAFARFLVAKPAARLRHCYSITAQFARPSCFVSVQVHRRYHWAQ